jgi:hypothetical protein
LPNHFETAVANHLGAFLSIWRKQSRNATLIGRNLHGAINLMKPNAKAGNALCGLRLGKFNIGRNSGKRESERTGKKQPPVSRSY